MRLLFLVETAFALTSKMFLLFTRGDHERVVTIRDYAFFIQSTKLAEEQHLVKAYFRVEGTRIMVNKVPICAREFSNSFAKTASYSKQKPLPKMMELCDDNEPNDQWEVVIDDNLGTVILRSEDGTNCVFYDVYRNEYENMLFAQDCDSIIGYKVFHLELVSHEKRSFDDYNPSPNSKGPWGENGNDENRNPLGANRKSRSKGGNHHAQYIKDSVRRPKPFDSLPL